MVTAQNHVSGKSLVYKPKNLGTKTLISFFPAPFSCKNPTPSELSVSCCSREGFKVSKMSAGKNNTSDFVPNFHGMLTDLTTIGVQRVTGSSPLRDNYFFYSFFKFLCQLGVFIVFLDVPRLWVDIPKLLTVNILHFI